MKPLITGPLNPVVVVIVGDDEVKFEIIV